MDQRIRLRLLPIQVVYDAVSPMQYGEYVVRVVNSIYNIDDPVPKRDFVCFLLLQDTVDRIIDIFLLPKNVHLQK